MNAFLTEEGWACGNCGEIQIFDPPSPSEESCVFLASRWRAEDCCEPMTFGPDYRRADIEMRRALAVGNERCNAAWLIDFLENKAVYAEKQVLASHLEYRNDGSRKSELGALLYAVEKRLLTREEALALAKVFGPNVFGGEESYKLTVETLLNANT